MPMNKQGFFGNFLRRLGRYRRKLFGVDILTSKMDLINEQLLDLRNSTMQMNQIRLMLEYQDLCYHGRPLPKFDDIEFRAYSQSGEDGILLYIFSLIGISNKKCIEICAGDGIECNTANLIINHGWEGLLFDGNEELVKRGREFYAGCKDTWIWPPKFVNAWITADNVNELVSSVGFDGEIDLLSLDMDGIDWWIWKALTVMNPRVVVAEFQDCWEPGIAVTIPYSPDFVAIYDENGIPAYAGASLSAYVELARKKGYRLVGCQRYSFNAFFIRNDIGIDALPEVSPSEFLKHPKNKWGIEIRQAKIKDMEWLRVEDIL